MAIAATPAVVPRPRTHTVRSASGPESSAPRKKYTDSAAAEITTLVSTGAKAGAAKRRLACSTAVPSVIIP